MSGGIRGPLRLLGGAHAATAALVVLQTFVLRAVPYDASWFGGVASFFRAGFMAADVATIVALVVVNRRAPTIYPFTILASALLGLTISAAALGWILSAFDDKSGGTALGGIEPMLTFGASLLVAFTLASVLGPTAVPDRRRDIGFAAAVAFAVLVLMLRVGSSLAHDSSSMVVAWLRWALAVGQPASLAALAYLVAHAKEAADPAPDPLAAAAAAAGGGYRAAGEGAVAAARPDLATPGPATIEPMRIASSGVELHRTAFILRACIVGLMLFFAIGLARELAVIMLPVLGGGTAIAIAIGVGRQRALATFDVGPSMRAAHIAFKAAAVAEIGALLWVLAELTFHPRMEIFGLAFPAATLSAGLGVLFASRAHERAGDLLFRYRLAGLARWTQALLVLVVSSGLATFAAAAHADRRASTKLGPILAIAFGLLLLVSLLAVVVAHVMTLNEANRVLKDRLEKASTP